MPSVRVYQKKQLRLDLLNLRQRQMYELGAAGVAAVKARLAAAQGPEDSAAKPLTKRYAIFKARKGKGNLRRGGISEAEVWDISGSRGEKIRWKPGISRISLCRLVQLVNHISGRGDGR